MKPTLPSPFSPRLGAPRYTTTTTNNNNTTTISITNNATAPKPRPPTPTPPSSGAVKSVTRGGFDLVQGRAGKCLHTENGHKNLDHQPDRKPNDSQKRRETNEHQKLRDPGPMWAWPAALPRLVTKLLQNWCTGPTAGAMRAGSRRGSIPVPPGAKFGRETHENLRFGDGDSPVSHETHAGPTDMNVFRLVRDWSARQRQIFG